MNALLLSAPEICELQDEKVRLESENKILRKQLIEFNSIAYNLTARLVMIHDVGEKHGHTIIRRESVMDAVVDWRHRIDKISKIYYDNILALNPLKD